MIVPARFSAGLFTGRAELKSGKFLACCLAGTQQGQVLLCLLFSVKRPIVPGAGFDVPFAGANLQYTFVAYIHISAMRSYSSSKF